MNDVDWGVRAAAWELAALSLRYPDAELAEAAAGGLARRSRPQLHFP